MRELGASAFYAKEMPLQDNGKHGIYLGGSFKVLQVIPFGAVVSSIKSSKCSVMPSPLHFSWIGGPSLTPSRAKEAKLVLYPQYPEIRLSGFVRGAQFAPAEWLSETKKGSAVGRILYLGITNGGEVMAYLGEPDSSLNKSFTALRGSPALSAADAANQGVLDNLTALLGDINGVNSDDKLLGRLKSVHLKGWIEARRLYADGTTRPCFGTNCGGVTLESELGISSNGRSEPDFFGWEIKQHKATTKLRHAAGSITLFTPEPDGGEYVQGIEEFLQSYGTVAISPNKKYFKGRHFAGVRQSDTGMTLCVDGFNQESGKIIEVEGGLRLISSQGSVAASWSFSKILTHWCRKHAKAVYVPAQRDAAPKGESEVPSRYRYGSIVRLCRETDAAMFLMAVSRGIVFYDPGIRQDLLTGKVKPRSQFRVNFNKLDCLYSRSEDRDVMKM
jgi:hypothetical protein